MSRLGLNKGYLSFCSPQPSDQQLSQLAAQVTTTTTTTARELLPNLSQDKVVAAAAATREHGEAKGKMKETLKYHSALISSMVSLPLLLKRKPLIISG